jgi:hypothetical protein
MSYDHHLESFCKSHCDACDFVEKMTKQNIWIHSGHGVYGLSAGGYSFDDYEKIPTSTIRYKKNSSLELSELKPLSTFFIGFDSLGHTSNVKLNSGFKPSYGVWFSRGNWIMDPYCKRQNASHHDISLINKKKLTMVQNPINILSIKSAEDFINFNTKYTSSNIFLDLINWQAISNEGYYGVSFDFSKSR